MGWVPTSPTALACLCVLLLEVSGTPGYRGEQAEPRAPGQRHQGSQAISRAGGMEHLGEQDLTGAGRPRHTREQPVPRTGGLGHLGEEAVPRTGGLGHLGEEPVPRTGGLGHQGEEAVPRTGGLGHQGEEAVPRTGGLGHLGEEAVPRKEEQVPMREQPVPRTGGVGHPGEEAVPRKEQQVLQGEQPVPRASGQRLQGERTVPRIGGQSPEGARPAQRQEGYRTGGEEQESPKPGLVQKQVEAALDFTRRCWHQMSRQLWPEECTRDDDVRKPGWTLPLVGQVYLEMLTSWYCGVWGCEPRDCKVSYNLTGLEMDLNRRLHGQHLARQVILKVLPPFLRDRKPEKALTLSFHGWSGTGKNFVTRLMAENFYRDGMKSDCVKVFIAQLHFPHARYLELYKVQLEKHLKETNWRCKRSLFIFDEAEKLHPDLVDTIRPYVSRYKEAGEEDYRQSIFLFLSNVGGNAINEVVRNFWRAGRRREEITEGDLERPLKAEMSSTKGEEFAQSRLQAGGLIDALVPFLPLEYRHVKLCARDAFVARGLPYTEAALDQVAQMMVFVPKEEKLFSASGCKSVSQRISYL
ncbi:torsin-3A [Pleurodeles waltl]|uniref:torsin-3A n=1 Tax=Pleurodeles waltl TaxID=8319 RepID=UPI003709C02B